MFTIAKKPKPITRLRIDTMDHVSLITSSRPIV